MNTDYIIIQAGGKGSRLKHLTRNKPKALTPIGPRPMIFHLFEKYPDKHFIVIGDYQYEVLERYLNTFATVEFDMIDARGQQGTCAGLKAALAKVPEKETFMLIWSDLVLPDEFSFPEKSGNYIGVAKDFPCRWSFANDEFYEERSESFGVAGLFVFENKTLLESVPESGEFVRWLSGQRFERKELPLYKTKEYGLLTEWEKIPSQRCRPFNRITVDGDRICKEGIDQQGRELAVRETAWYKKVYDKGFTGIPTIFSFEPLVMERIKGKNIYEYNHLTHQEKRGILEQIINCLLSVQNLETVAPDRSSFEEAYIHKTLSRLEKIWDLVPFGREREIVINGRRCRNVLYHKNELWDKVAQYYPKCFKLIHGDCTFSNTMLREDGTPVLIDPRGYFGFTEFYGDPAYDWAKLYYSIVGNYDQFNLKRFDLEIGAQEVRLTLASSQWEDMESDFFELLKGYVTPEQIKLFHAIIWLSLTTYAWEDYDSICGAFYNGLYYLEEVL